MHGIGDNVDTIISIAHFIIVLVSPVAAYFLWQMKNSLNLIAEHTVRIAILEERIMNVSGQMKEMKQAVSILSSDVISLKGAR